MMEVNIFRHQYWIMALFWFHLGMGQLLYSFNGLLVSLALVQIIQLHEDKFSNRILKRILFVLTFDVYSDYSEIQIVFFFYSLYWTITYKSM